MWPFKKREETPRLTQWEKDTLKIERTVERAIHQQRFCEGISEEVRNGLAIAIKRREEWNRAKVQGTRIYLVGEDISWLEES